MLFVFELEIYRKRERENKEYIEKKRKRNKEASKHIWACAILKIILNEQQKGIYTHTYRYI